MSGECDCCGEHTLECVCKQLKEIRDKSLHPELEYGWEYTLGGEQLQCERRGDYPIQIAEAKMYDRAGEEIHVPKCEKCGSFKNMLMGRETFMWICACGE